METATKHVHHGSRKTKIIVLKGDRFFQAYRVCDEDRRQFDFQITELKKGPYRGQGNH